MPSPTRQTQNSPLAEFIPQVRNGLEHLLRAFDYAHDLECSPWDFSVEIEHLLASGMTTSDLRWLIRCGYLVHARELTGPDDTDRRFDARSQSLVFFPNTCFILTASGLALMGRDVAGMDQSAPLRLHLGSSPVDAAQPNWDPDSRTFTVGEHLVKQFRVPSQNQEAVLNAFQEEGWPRYVDDPLPPLPDQKPKRRLRDTIKCLNMNQVTRAIRFRGDGTGQRVSWELLIEASAPAGSLPLRRAA